MIVSNVSRKNATFINDPSPSIAQVRLRGHDHTLRNTCAFNHKILHQSGHLVTLEDDTVLECDVVAIFKVNDRDYIALNPTTDRDDEVFLYRLNYTKDDVLDLENILDDQEYALAAEAFEELLED